LEVCESRDVKGLYKKAREGIIKNFTGISDPYEAPEHAALDIRTDLLSLDQSVDFVIKKMMDDGILSDNSAPRVSNTLIETVTDEVRKEFENLKFIDVNVEQAEYIQTLNQGWAYPLNKFMDEIQLLEVLHMKTLTDSDGKKHLFSVPITQSVTKEEREALKDEKKVAIKCTAISQDVLAIIENPVFFDNRKEEICTRVFGVRSLKHPKVERIEQQGDYLISGSSMRFVAEIKFNDGLDQYRLTPQQVDE